LSRGTRWVQESDAERESNGVKCFTLAHQNNKPNTIQGAGHYTRRPNTTGCQVKKIIHHDLTCTHVTLRQSRTKQGRVKLLIIGKLIKPKYTQVKLIRQNQQTTEKGIGSG
jgi:hypothetical protein